MVIILLKFGHRSLTLKPTPHQHLPWSGLPTQPLREKGENPTDHGPFRIQRIFSLLPSLKR